MCFVACKKEGCTDATASNFDSKAEKDDGSCVYNNPITPVSPTVIDTLCDGNPNTVASGQILPIKPGNEWDHTTFSGISLAFSETDSISKNGVTFYGLTSSSIFPWMLENYAGYDSQGNLVHTDKSSHSSFEIFIPNSLQVGTTWVLSDFTNMEIYDSLVVVSLSETYSTSNCNYTDLTQINVYSTSNKSHSYTYYFKIGLGVVRFLNHDSFIPTDAKLTSVKFK